MESSYIVPATEIELETGLGKELLRKWRQRYGFPALETDSDGKVGYTRKSIQHLLLIKRLLDAGFRPAQIVGKAHLELERLLRAIENDKQELGIDLTTRKLLDLVKKSDMVGLQSRLAEKRSKSTLSEFVLKTIVPLVNEVGNAWSRNEIDIYHEHLSTALIQRMLNAEMLLCKPKPGYPKVLFSTPPQELHTFGLIVAEAVLADHGATTFSLGSHVPLNDVKMAAMALHVDVVSLSLSLAFPARSVRPTLIHLRQLLPGKVELWAGGAALSIIKRPLKGVRAFTDIQDAVDIMHIHAREKHYGH
jgi:methanogenic corrinoid protein MtbC1